MRFDFATFFRSIGVSYVTDGKNVKRGWTNINCPFCGDDRGFHLGCNPESGGWACWRDTSHRSMSTAKLIKAVKGCSWAEAKTIAGDDEEIKPGLETWDQLSQSVEQLDQDHSVKLSLTSMPSTFREIDRKFPRSLFWNYLVHARRFHPKDVEELCQDYRLRGCYADGKWSRRLILPFVTEAGIVGWQGRAIGQAKTRYETYPNSDISKRIIFNQGPVSGGGKLLTIVEGPIDSLKLDVYGKHLDYRAGGTLGTAFSNAQVNIIDQLASHYDRLMLLFDPKAEAAVMRLASMLSRHSPIIGFFPEELEDPGALDPKKVVKVIRELSGI